MMALENIAYVTLFVIMVENSDSYLRMLDTVLVRLGFMDTAVMNVSFLVILAFNKQMFLLFQYP